MRLLNTATLQLESFFDPYLPQYAILSHTWGEEEILFDDIPARDSPRSPVALPIHKKGFAKVDKSCRQARHDGYGYIWIDTCCIDKSSSAELSEAINSMFQWYLKARRCYAYLVDVNAPEGERSVHFGQSRWFTRGWTLQELIAPRDICFYDHNWRFLGRRQTIASRYNNPPGPSEDLAEMISNATYIPIGLLRWNRAPQRPSKQENATMDMSDSESDSVEFLDMSTSRLADLATLQLTTALRHFSVAQKMSWAARRQTTRVEDEAYCLLGLFEVNMPLLYGEGRRAFSRLQHEILRVSNDQSILAFDHLVDSGGFFHPTEKAIPLLAASARAFAGLQVERPRQWPPAWPGAPATGPEMSPSPRFLEIGLCLCPVPTVEGDGIDLGILHCVRGGDSMSHPAIALAAVHRGNKMFKRINGHGLEWITPFDMPTPDNEQPDARPAVDLTKASFEVIRIYFDPPELQVSPHAWYLPSFLRQPYREAVAGIRIHLPSQEPFVLDGSDAYPNDLQRDYYRRQVYARSGLDIGSGANHQPTRHLTLRPSELLEQAAAPRGVIILRFSRLGDLVVAWGQSQSPWFAIFTWETVALACGLGPVRYQGSDTAGVARLLYERQQSWMPLEAQIFSPVVELALSSYTIRCRAEVVNFFGRRVLDVGMDIVGQIDQGEGVQTGQGMEEA